MDEIVHITSLIRKTFDKNAWHGPAVREVLHDITPQQALQKLPNTHNIIELVAHMTAWRVFTVKKLQGDTTYQINDELNFPSTADWPKAVQLLDDSQTALLKAVENFPVEKLRDLVPHATHRYTFYTLLHGIVHHDLYHLGQIVLIKKATA